MTFEQKSNWPRRNLQYFFQDFLKSTAKSLGEIADYGIRIEFQARGSPHAHCVTWVKDAPKFGQCSVCIHKVRIVCRSQRRMQIERPSSPPPPAQACLLLQEATDVGLTFPTLPA